MYKLRQSIIIGQIWHRESKLGVDILIIEKTYRGKTDVRIKYCNKDYFQALRVDNDIIKRDFKLQDITCE